MTIMTENEDLKQRYNDRARESLILSLKSTTTYAMGIIAAFWWVAIQPKGSVVFNGWSTNAMIFAVGTCFCSLAFWFTDTRRNYCRSAEIADWQSKVFERPYYWLIGGTFCFLFAAVVCAAGYVWSVASA